VTARIRKIPTSTMTADQRELYQAIAGGRRTAGPQAFDLLDAEGQLEGPFNAMLLSPALGHALQALGSAVRYETAFTGRARELAILAVAYAWGSEFERYAHEAVARAVGLADAELAAIQQGRFADLADPYEQVVAATASTLATGGDLDDAGYARAHEVLGEAGLFELTTLVGYYAALALQLRVFRVTAPGGNPAE
jgi:4-carboxymuconolactone decarboxylase